MATGMLLWRIDREVTGFNGTQSFGVKAKTKDEAFEIFKSGIDEFIEEEVDIVNLSDITLDEIYECDEENYAQPAGSEKGIELMRKEFEFHILNNRMDDPKNGSTEIDPITNGYIDPRIQYGWVCWQAAIAV